MRLTMDWSGEPRKSFAQSDRTGKREFGQCYEEVPGSRRLKAPLERQVTARLKALPNTTQPDPNQRDTNRAVKPTALKQTTVKRTAAKQTARNSVIQRRCAIKRTEALAERSRRTPSPFPLPRTCEAFQPRSAILAHVSSSRLEGRSYLKHFPINSTRSFFILVCEAPSI